MASPSEKFDAMTDQPRPTEALIARYDALAEHDAGCVHFHSLQVGVCDCRIAVLRADLLSALTASGGPRKAMIVPDGMGHRWVDPVMVDLAALRAQVQALTEELRGWIATANTRLSRAEAAEARLREVEAERDAYAGKLHRLQAGRVNNSSTRLVTAPASQETEAEG